MFFITNRHFKEGPKTLFGRQVTFDLTDNHVSQSVYFCERKGLNNYIELGSNAFLTNLRSSPYKQILLYIHGFNCQPEETIFTYTQILQSLFDQREENFVQVLPLIWPCDNDIGIIRDYWDDQRAADMSAYAFVRALELFLDWQTVNYLDTLCTKRVNVLAHSMGNRVLQKTLNLWQERSAQGVLKIFRTIFMIAADIVNEALERGNEGDVICDAARNVCVYFAGDDMALQGSKIVNIKNNIMSRRLGHTGPENPSLTLLNVYAFDCDDFNNEYDYPMGHTYFLTLDNTETTEAGIIFNHIYETLKTGRPLFENTVRRVILK